MPRDIECTCFTVRRAARSLTQAYDRHLARAGLKTTQFSLMRTLIRLGPLSIQALAREMGLDRTTLGRNLRPLERDSMVTIAVNDADRRGRAIDVTPSGRAKVAAAEPLWRAAQTSFESAYGIEQTRSLHETLNAVAVLDLAAAGDAPSLRALAVRI